MMRRWFEHPYTRDLNADDPRTTEMRRRILTEKPFLRRIYEEWYREIIDALPVIRGRTLEIGSGAGFLREYIVDLVTSDVLTLRGVSLVLDARALPFVRRSLRSIVMINTFHHIADPYAFICEAARCVRPQGRVIMIEPWTPLWSRFAYQRLHHEKFCPGAEGWQPRRNGPLTTANGALPWIIFSRDRERFGRWTQSLAFLQTLLGSDHPYVEHFKKKVARGYTGSTKAGVGILQSVREDLANGNIPDATVATIDPLPQIEELCSRFHLVARQLRSRHDNRETLNVSDEYDVQDLLHSLLWLFFDDVRPEETTPSYAGKSSRIDFLLKNEQIVIEVKKTHAGLGAREIGSQLIEDIDRYKVHPDCQLLVCFVYDPEGLVANPRGIENDLYRDDGPMPVRVLIRPA